MALRPADLEKTSSSATLRSGLDHVAEQQVKMEKKGSEEKLEAELQAGLCKLEGCCIKGATQGLYYSGTLGISTACMHACRRSGLANKA